MADDLLYHYTSVEALYSMVTGRFPFLACKPKMPGGWKPSPNDQPYPPQMPDYMEPLLRDGHPSLFLTNAFYMNDFKEQTWLAHLAIADIENEKRHVTDQFWAWVKGDLLYDVQRRIVVNNVLTLQFKTDRHAGRVVRIRSPLT